MGLLCEDQSEEMLQAGLLKQWGLVLFPSEARGLRSRCHEAVLCGLCSWLAGGWSPAAFAHTLCSPAGIPGVFVQISSPDKDTCRIGLGPALTTSFELITSLQSHPETSRAPPCGFWELDTVCPLTS